MKDFPSKCHVGLYNSSISSCHLSGSRYFMTSSSVFSVATASDSSSTPCCDGAGGAGGAGTDALCRKEIKMGDLQNHVYSIVSVQNVLNGKHD